LSSLFFCELLPIVLQKVREVPRATKLKKSLISEQFEYPIEKTIWPSLNSQYQAVELREESRQGLTIARVSTRI